MVGNRIPVALSGLFGMNPNGSPIGRGTSAIILGPMYHLFTDEEKLQARAEAIQVTKKGGIIFSAYYMGDSNYTLDIFRKE